MARRLKRGASRRVDARTTAAPRWENFVDCPYRPSFRQRCLASTAIAGLVLAGGMTDASLANPTGGAVVAGSATISQPSSAVTQITQQSSNVIIDWRTFSIAQGELTQFYQPSRSAWALNRVKGGDPSVIAGRLRANGNIAIVNASGIVFEKGSQVDVNSLIATTANIHNRDFMAGNFNFNIPSANPNATVTNAGQISIGEHGLAALVGPGVANSGIIQAKLGKVVLGGAETFTVDFYGDGLINFEVGSKVAQAPIGPDGKPMPLVSNTGQIYADGGSILLTADAVDNIVTNMVEAGGTLQAQSIGANTGNILIDGGSSAGGTVLATGTIDASGREASATGGSVAVVGDRVGVMSGALIDASGDAGGGTVLIGGNFHGAGPQQNAALTVVQQGASIKADAITSGNGGKVAVWSNSATGVYGAISARGGALGGNGGMIETSSKGALDIAGAHIDTSAMRGATGLWLLDPTAVSIDAQPTSGGFTLPPPGGTFSDTTDTTADLNFQDLQTALGLSNIVVQASSSISLAHDVAWGNTNQLSLQAGTTISLSAKVTAAAGALDLQAQGAITQSAGIINVATLTATSTTDSVTLNGDVGGSGKANMVAQLGNVSAGANLNFNNGQSLTSTGTWSAVGNLSVTASGGTSDLSVGAVSGASVVLIAGRDMSLTGNVTGTTQLTLNAGGGISQTAGTTITAGTLKGSAAGTVNLASTSNQVTSLGDFATGNGNFSLGNGISLTIAGTVNAGTGTVDLDVIGATSTINETTGTITAGTLEGSAGAAAALNSLNHVANFGPFTTGGDLSFIDAETLSSSGAWTAGGQLLVTTMGAGSDLNVGNASAVGSAVFTAANNLAVNGNVSVGNGTLTLNASGGISQTVGTTITAGTLKGSAAGTVNLASTSNQVTSLGDFATGNGNFSLGNGISLTIAGTVNAGTGTVDLDVIGATSTINETTGTITAATLQGNSTAGTTLNSANNHVTNLGTFTAGGDLSFTDAQALGSTGVWTAGGNLLVTTTGGVGSDLTVGSGSAGGSVVFTSAHNLTLNGAMTAGGDSALIWNGPTLAIPGILSIGAHNIFLGFTGQGLVPTPATLANIITFGGGLVVQVTNPTGDIPLSSNNFARIGEKTINGASTDTFSYTYTGVGSLTVGVDLALPASTGLSGPYGIATSGNVVVAANGLGGEINVIHPVSGLNVTLAASTDIALNADVTATTMATLNAGTTITQALGTTLSANILTGNAGGAVSLGDPTNAIANLAGFNTNGNDFTLKSGGPLTITGNLNAGISGVVELDVPGGISESNTGTITANTLNGSSNAAVSLTNTGNTIINLGGFTTNGSNFSLTDGLALAVTGAVNTNGGALSLTVPGSFFLAGLTITGSLDSGAGTTTITEAVGSAVVGAPDILAPGTPALLISDSSLGQITAGGGVILTTNGATADLFVNGVTAHANYANLTLNAGRNLFLDGNVGAAGTLTLNVPAGLIFQDAGFITANTLTGNAGTSATMSQHNQVANLGPFNANVDLSFTDARTLLSSGTWSAGRNLTVATTAGFDLNAGLATAGTNLTLAAGGNLTLNQNITAGNIATLTAGNLVLNLPGSINQLGGIITANTLTGSAGTTATMNQLNKITSLGPFSAGVDLSFTDAQTLFSSGAWAAGRDLTVTTMAGSGLTAGVATAGTNLTLAAGANLTLNGNITAGTAAGDTATLTAGGAINQNGGVITANTLTGSAGTTATMNQLNQVTNLGPFSAGADLSFTDAQTLLSSGTWSAGGNLTVTTTAGFDLNAGLATATGNLALAAGGNLTLNQNITAGNIVTLSAGNLALNLPGSINQLGGIITANTLTGSAGTTATMNQLNKITNLGTFSTGVDLSFSDAQTLHSTGGWAAGEDLTVTTVGAGSDLVAGLATATRNLTLAAGGNLTLNQNVTAGNIATLTAGGTINQNGGAVSGTNVTLTAGTDLVLNQNITAINVATLTAGGTINQDGGIITANTLTGSSVGGASLNMQNQVTLFGNFTNATSGDLSFTDNRSLQSAGQWISSGNVTVTTTGAGSDLTTELITAGTAPGGGNVTLTASGNIVINSAITAVTGNPGTGTVKISSGIVIEVGGGAITANLLTGSSVNGAIFQGGNLVDNFSSFTNATGNRVQLTNLKSVNVGAITSAGDVTIETVGANSNVNLTGNVTAMSGGLATGTVTLQSGGAITQSSGVITANTLTGVSGAGASMTDANHVAHLGTFTAGGDLSFADAMDFTTATLSAEGKVILTGGGAISLGGDISAGPIISVAATDALTIPGSLTLSASSLVQLGGATFTIQTGDLTVRAPALQIVSRSGGVMESDLEKAQGFVSANQDQIAKLEQVIGPGIGVVKLGSTLDAPQSQVLISVGSGSVSGSVNVGALAIGGDGSTAQLTGSIGGVSGPGAAGLGTHSPRPDNADRFNNCAIGTVNCIVLPQVVPFIVTPINVIDLLEAQPPSDPIDIDRLNTGSEDSL